MKKIEDMFIDSLFDADSREYDIIAEMFRNDDDYQDSAYLFDPTGKLLTDEEEIPLEVLELAQERAESRESKDFEKADKLRDEIKLKGYTVEDSKEGVKVKKTN